MLSSQHRPVENGEAVPPTAHKAVWLPITDQCKATNLFLCHLTPFSQMAKPTGSMVAIADILF
jgi:hypothetical protein